MSKTKACLVTAIIAALRLSGLVASLRTGPPARAEAATPDGPVLGTAALTSGWRLQSSAMAGHDGAKISHPGYQANGWLPLSKPQTLMAGLLENGRYPNIFHGDNLAKVPSEQFKVNWWYREQITVRPRPGRYTFLTMNGINGDADLWVNLRAWLDFGGAAARLLKIHRNTLVARLAVHRRAHRSAAARHGHAIKSSFGSAHPGRSGRRRRADVS